LISNKIQKKIKIGILLGCFFFFIFASQIHIPLSTENKPDNKFDTNVKTNLDPIHDLTGTTIFIDNTDPLHDWATFQATYAWCIGDGSAFQPYTIPQVLIDGPNITLITIKNSDVYFSLTWCDLLNGYHAIYLDNVTNGEILYNYCSRGAYGIYLDSDSSFNNISGNIVTYNTITGISLHGSSNNSISENTVSYNDEYGIRLTEPSNDNNITKNTLNSKKGIMISHCADNLISENTIRSQASSIYIVNSDSIIIIKNTLYNGLNLWGSANLTFSNNLLDGPAMKFITIYLMDTSGSKFIENELKWAEFKITFHSDNNSFIGNVLSDPPTAFYFKDSSYNEVINNSIYRAGRCFQESGNCIGNVFIGNTCQEGMESPFHMLGAIIGSIAVVGVTVFMFLRRRKYLRK
jgi:parallel beta-helix repeat protein